MMLLAIETTGPLCSVALGGGEEIARLVNDTAYSHLEAVAPMVTRIMAEAGVSPSQLDAVAVSRGPGSFTGIRIGMATAKGLAQIWEKPIVCVPTLESFAYASGLPADGSPIVCPLFDARRSQVYAAAYLPAGAGGARTLVSGAARGIEEYLALLSRAARAGAEAVFYGDGCAPYADALAAWDFPHRIAPEEERYQLADRVLRLAEKQFAAGELWDCYSAEPEYMRPSEPERKLKEKNADAEGRPQTQGPRGEEPERATGEGSRRIESKQKLNEAFGKSEGPDRTDAKQKSEESVENPSQTGAACGPETADAEGRPQTPRGEERP